jgi:(p)ppGpp synthase/HD superfamily hydrolase
MRTEDETVVALLHDTVEDTPVTPDDLRARGFSETQIEAVDALTKRNGERYADYVKRAAETPSRGKSSSRT